MEKKLSTAQLDQLKSGIELNESYFILFYFELLKGISHLCLGALLLHEKQINYDSVIADLTEQLANASSSMRNWEVRN